MSLISIQEKIAGKSPEISPKTHRNALKKVYFFENTVVYVFPVGLGIKAGNVAYDWLKYLIDNRILAGEIYQENNIVYAEVEKLWIDEGFDPGDYWYELRRNIYNAQFNENPMAFFGHTVIEKGIKDIQQKYGNIALDLQSVNFGYRKDFSRIIPFDILV